MTANSREQHHREHRMNVPHRPQTDLKIDAQRRQRSYLRWMLLAGRTTCIMIK